MQGIVAYLLGGVVIHTRDTCRSVGVVELLGGVCGQFGWQCCQVVC